jgi:hypothetical protein
MLRRAGLWTACFLWACAPAKAARAPDPALVAARQVNRQPLPAPSADLGAPPALEPEAVSSPAPTPAPRPSPAPASVPVEPSDPDVAAAEKESEQADHGAVVRRLRVTMARIDREAPLDERLLAHALLGRSLEARHDRAGARRQYASVVEAWKAPAAAARSIAEAEKDERVALKRVGRALNAVGEALYFGAREKKRLVDAAKPPAFAGPQTPSAVNKFFDTKVRDWIQKRRALLADAQREFQRVVQLEPVPPPLWVVASAAEVGDMLATFADDVERVPVPDRVRKDPKAHRLFRSSLAETLEPQRQAALAAFRTCKAYAEKFRAGREHAERCDRGMVALEKVASP